MRGKAISGVTLTGLSRQLQVEAKNLAGHLVPGVGGISARLDPGRFVLMLAGDDEAEVCDLARETGIVGLHAMVYRALPQARAAICGQPVMTTALAMAGITVARCICHEAPSLLGTAGARPDPTRRDLERLLPEAPGAVLLGRHGLLTFGTDLRQARARLQRIEHAAQVTVTARGLGDHAPLGERELVRWQALAADLGLSGGSTAGCERCNACAHGQLSTGPAPLAAAVDSYLRR